MSLAWKKLIPWSISYCVFQTRNLHFISLSEAALPFCPDRVLIWKPSYFIPLLETKDVHCFFPILFPPTPLCGGTFPLGLTVFVGTAYIASFHESWDFNSIVQSLRSLSSCGLSIPTGFRSPVFFHSLDSLWQVRCWREIEREREVGLGIAAGWWRQAAGTQGLCWNALFCGWWWVWYGKW